jgi:CheY-like chemotaxis protein
MANVLVVDDDADSAELLCRMLTRGGHRCSSVPNGKQAMAALLYELPDVLVLDLYMPEMSGADLLGIIRSYLRLQTLPVIVVTADPNGAAAKRARDLGAKQVLAKAEFTPDDLLTAVAGTLA